jgi:hypothetical protein
LFLLRGHNDGELLWFHLFLLLFIQEVPVLAVLVIFLLESFCCFGDAGWDVDRTLLMVNKGRQGGGEAWMHGGMEDREAWRHGCMDGMEA